MTQVDRLDGLVGNTAIKVPCRAATTAQTTLSGEKTIDGIALVTGDRILVKDQTDQTENGIYVVDSGDWSRSADCNGNNDLTAGTLVLVTGGTAVGVAMYRQSTVDPEIGSDNIVWTINNNALAGVTAYMATLLAAGNQTALLTLMGFFDYSIQPYFNDTNFAGSTINHATTWSEKIAGAINRTIAAGGEQTMPKQPAFYATSAGSANATGDSTGFYLNASTEVYDVNADYDNATYTFTAPVTGKYYFSWYVQVSGMGAAHTSELVQLVTSNRNYDGVRISPYATVNGFGQVGICGFAVADMDAGDTAKLLIAAYGGTKTVSVDNGSSFGGGLLF